MGPDAGQVYYLPPELAEGPEKGDRPHLVLSVSRPGSETATFAYCSTRGTDAAHGAAHVVIDPFSTSYRGTGLRHATYVYPSRLLSYDIRWLPRPSGRILDEMPIIRTRLRFALGLGRGVTDGANVPMTNRRGRIVEYTARLADALEATHGVAVTEPAYSRAGYQQTTIPLLDHRDFESRPGDAVIRESKGTRWLRWLSGGQRPWEMIAAVPFIFTVFERDGIRRFTDVVIDPESMSSIDEALAAHFGL